MGDVPSSETGLGIEPKEEKQTPVEQLLSELQKVLTPSAFDVRPRVELIPGKLWLTGFLQVLQKPWIEQTEITHIVNMAGGNCNSSRMLKQCDCCVGYLQVDADDAEGYDLFQHYAEVEEFISSAIQNNGCVAIHCMMGVNRSVAMALAYLVLHEGQDLIDAATHIQEKRTNVLSNWSFREQLVKFVTQTKTNAP
eukprot:TRINITY_DN68132_c2_g2_i10.p1 TRINITY_DN68132_c2_g2~~TRINITY_DN68132_c2_g2_i10.p1  ORF type:complete len:195 (-),score=17.51 TRINITY_DN68132_c2_g2_i10:269-853(-)